ncbi:MAG: PepSY domain-containing protein [Nitrosotalea sp.]
MNIPQLKTHQKMLAMILGVAVIATFGASLAYAQTTTTQTPTKIVGSVNLPAVVLSEVKVPFTTAAATAAGAPGITNGQIISGGLRAVQGSLVYGFEVTDGTSVYSVIVDAGSGSILHTSAAHPLSLGALGIGSNGMMGHKAHMGSGAWKQKSSTTTTSPSTGSQ